MADSSNGRVASDRLLAAIVATSDDAIVSKSLDGIIQTWNAAAERMFGYTAKQAIGQHISLIIPRDRLAEEDVIMARLRAGQRVDHFETDRMHRDGRRIPVSLTISPIKDAQGRIVGASKFARDMTERRAIEEELRQANRTKDSFIATLSHELRNPLAPIRAAAQLIRQKAAQHPEIRHSSDVIERQLKHLVRLLEDLLDISRISTNKVELQRSVVPLASIIRDATEASIPIIDAAQHRLSVALPDEIVHLDCDPVRVAQVLANVLNNAAKYMMRGGQITLRAAVVGDFVEISVKDQGVGIAPEVLPKIFQMYWQASSEAERRQGGLGIGLALSRAIVELHGGTIEARSDGVRKGSEFIIRLPYLKHHTPAPARPAAPDVERPRNSRRVLIVDDVRDTADALAELLRVLGHETQTAYDGATAIASVREARPDAMLIDLGMPGMSGTEVCRSVRVLDSGKEIYMIALTGWGQAGDRAESAKAGFDLHLVKPVDGYALAEIISNLDRRSVSAPGQDGPAGS